MHISLDAALQRQPLLSTVGDKLLPTFPGAAAAYSLRALNGDANNVVNVRRDADDEERDFTAEGVAFELEDWVNGKLEDTLPADVATSAAAYSLRKVRNAYSGNAVQIRRASDDVEVNVAFDSNGEVSTSSAISNIPVGNFPTSVAQNRTGAARYATFNTDGIYSFSAIANAVALGGYVIDEGRVGDVVTVSFDLTLNSGSINSVVLRPELETGSDVSNSSGSISSSGSYSFDLTATDTYSVVAFISVDGNFTVSNVSIQVRQDAGDTTATTLGAFLTEEVTTYTADWSSSTDGWTNYVGGAVTSREASYTDGSGVTKTNVLLSSGGETNNLNSNQIPSRQSGNQYRMTGFVLADVDGNFDSQSTLSWTSPTVVVANTWTAISATFTVNSDGTWNFRFNQDSTAESSLRLAEIQIEQLTSDATVVTWYDQSGNGNDATQDTTGSQPKIAEGGSLLADNGKPEIRTTFAGSEHLQVSGGTIPRNNDFTTSVFSVLRSTLSTQPSGSGAASIMNFSMDGTNSRFYFGTDQLPRDRVYARMGDTTPYSSVTSFADEERFLLSLFNANENGRMAVDGAITFDATVSYGTDTITEQTVTIGSSTNGFEGAFSEVILYQSDQSANRFKIESNINNYYGIYTAAYDGFVETWYDQSGNGNHAVQDAVEGYQPKIVSAGSLLEGVDFDGVDDFLATSSAYPTGTNLSAFVVADSAGDNQRMIDTRGTGPSGTTVGWQMKFSNSDDTATFDDGSKDLVTEDIFRSGKNLISVLASLSSLEEYTNGSLSDSDTSVTLSTFNSGNALYMGANVNGQNTQLYNGLLQEIVLYNSDQSANRTAIESNIANEYGITLS